ncbi:RBL1 [Branchiostoma lanceolatum]|uniref:RBL1 protein n=1 Tax=Branchiostoma lanceolatum TaxID=7740 RepID=A0A8S4MNW7_BRALA|nr:RBL1 [Branchiostoma lanceolatum]
MAGPDEETPSTEQRYQDLCMDLNMDKIATEEAWQSFEKMSTNYTLEGDDLHWLACALYVACRKSLTPTVGRGTVEGNCVSLTRLLRSARLSLIQFFNKMKKWADMASLPQDFRDKVDRLERNFAVSTVIFKKFQPIFLDLFRNPGDDQPRAPRGRKQRRLPCTSSDVFSFCWTLFVQVKGNFPAISDDLVNSYHLLLCCLDLFFGNALCAGRKDLLNTEFPALPEGFTNRDWRSPSEPPCIIEKLCELHDGLVLEAKGIKEHWWKPYIKKLFDKKTLKGRQETLTGLLDLATFEINNKSINKEYEEWVLTVGDFDERIFLGEDADVEIGTPAKPAPNITGELGERMVQSSHLKQHMAETKSLAPSTPLTGRRYLKEKDPTVTPVSTATQSVSRLQALLAGLKTAPSDNLTKLFSECSRNPQESISSRIKEMGEQFCTSYTQPSEDHPGSHIEFAQKRLRLAETLYYKVLENIMLQEKKRLKGKLDLVSLMEQDVFHRSLMACCLEIIIFSYNSQRTFPWIIDVFGLSPYHFYKVIEVLIRAEDGLSRDVVKHLNFIEEQILESLAWKSESPLWEAMKLNENAVPSCEEVTLPSQLENGHSNTAVRMGQSPPVHPQVRRIARDTGVMLKKVESPLSPLSAHDRFSSPAAGSLGTAKRRLFSNDQPSNAAATTTSAHSQSVHVVTTATDQGVQQTITQQTVAIPIPSGSGTITYLATLPIVQQVQPGQQPQQIQLQAVPQGQQVPGANMLGAMAQAVATGQQQVAPSQTATVPHGIAAAAPAPGEKAAAGEHPSKRIGSLGLFFRKVYHLASVRLRDLCEKLEVGDELRRKMWTCFTHTLKEHVELMRDRHLDQIVMCSVYVMAKVSANVTQHDKSFQDIMKCYRTQPQASSHVYRSVLLHGDRERRSSGSSDGSGKTSPVTADKDKGNGERPIRSSSTLPVPAPSSAPPTPTRLAGLGATVDGDERGDLIQFYNTIFVTKLKSYVRKFSPTGDHKADSNIPQLSPIPLPRTHLQSPRRVSVRHPIYISPHKNGRNFWRPLTPTSAMLYCFGKSPAKNLQDITSMIKSGEQPTKKRALNYDTNENPAKRLCSVGSADRTLFQKLKDIDTVRQAANANQ